MNVPFELKGGSFGWWVAGYAALWGLLLLMVEAGGGDFAAALSVLVASGMTVVAAEGVIRNFREVRGGSS